MTISVAAGKGGTGKTLVATSLAAALNGQHPDDVQLLDCDVEEPNAHILLHPRIAERQPVHILVPQVDEAACTRCGRCAEACQFSAIAVIRDAVLTFPNLCSGCGACSYVCPVDAISEIERNVGALAIGGTTDGILFCEGRVNVGEQRSGPVTKAVKQHIHPGALAIIDAPPGTACPMQESIEGSDYCILVTEPTPFGLSDLRAAVDTCRSLGVPCGIVINRDGVGDAGVEQYCEQEGLPVLLRIPQRREIAEAYSRGETLTQAFPERVGLFCGMFATIESQLSVSEVR
ncbi:MAG: ATP-binding protein [Armatimonadota bacterium]|jgi:MinD superfamily P-loop ATPase